MTALTSRISKSPQVCGGEPRIRDTRHTVHGLVEWRRLGVADSELLLKFDPPLTQSDLDAAWQYAAAHPDEIERALWADSAAMVDTSSGERVEALVAEGRRLGLTDDAIREAFEPPLPPIDLQRTDRSPSANGAA